MGRPRNKLIEQTSIDAEVAYQRVQEATQVLVDTLVGKRIRDFQDEIDQLKKKIAGLEREREDLRKPVSTSEWAKALKEKYKLP